MRCRHRLTVRDCLDCSAGYFVTVARFKRYKDGAVRNERWLVLPFNGYGCRLQKRKAMIEREAIALCVKCPESFPSRAHASTAVASVVGCR